MTDVAVSVWSPWYRSVDRDQWRTLIASNLGWLFDGFETYALVLTAGPAMRSLLDASSYPQIPAYVGMVFAITLLGWAIGGMIGGVLADYIGRRRMMILAILAYSIMTGLTALAFDWRSFAVLRFLVGIAIGSEWVTGASLVAEFWPDRARGKGAGLNQGLHRRTAPVASRRSCVVSLAVRARNGHSSNPTACSKGRCHGHDDTVAKPDVACGRSRPCAVLGVQRPDGV